MASLGQAVSINSTGAAPDAQSILDISSTTRGVFLPRMTTAQRESLIAPLTTPADNHGLTVYDTSTKSYWYWDGLVWREIPNTSVAGITASNGLSEVSNDVQLGGTPLSHNTTVDQGAYTLDFASTAVDGFSIDGTTFSIDAANNRVGMGTSIPYTNLHLEVSSTGFNIPLVLRNKNGGGTTSGATVGIGFANEPSNYGNFFKAAIVHERLGNFGVGSMHFLLDNVGNGTSATMASARMTIQSDGNVGIGDQTPDAKLDVDAASGNLLILAQTGTTKAIVDINGNLTITGKFNSNGIQEVSDARYKKNIEKLNGALSKVMRIEGVTYNWRQDEFPERAFGPRTEIGFIAQELEKIYPELVNTNTDGYKSVQYSHMVPVLLEAMKEQQQLIETLMANVSTLNSDLKASNERTNEANGKILYLTAKLESIAEKFDEIASPSTLTLKY
ncbi:MAG: tail fiber domain-containing protein [Flavobacteriales bacterium]|nr:tail fiber domain-containing protein [Flavobacteriales bacterium]